MTQVTTGILDLPTDVFSVIASQLPAIDLIFFGRVSRAINSILNNSEIQGKIASFKTELTNTLSNRASELRGSSGSNGLINDAYLKFTDIRGICVQEGGKLRVHLTCYFAKNNLPFHDSQREELIDYLIQVKDVKSITQIDKNASQDIIEIKDAAVVSFKNHKTAENERAKLNGESYTLEGKLEEMKLRLNALRGPTGFDGLIDQAYKKMQSMSDIKSKEEYEVLIKELNELAMFDNNDVLIGGKIYVAESRLKALQGTHYNGLLNQAHQNESNLLNARDDAIRAFALAVDIPVGVAYSLVQIYLISSPHLIDQIETFAFAKKDEIEKNGKMQSLSEELNKLAVFNNNGDCIGGMLYKLRQ